MKINLALINRIIDLPSNDIGEIRSLFDELGLEIKNVEGEGDRTELTIETLANRGDHLSALGMGREISARLLTPIKMPVLAKEFAAVKPSLPVRVQTAKCLRYALLEMTIPPGLELREGIAPMLGAERGGHHPVVDTLNYVQLEIGQPMHAFDRDLIEGEIQVVEAEKAEEIEALDGKTYLVPAGAILIRDRKKTVAAAGVIGCANSMVTAKTARVLIESACFDPVAVRLAARAMKISTDASHAFERGSDIEAVQIALRRVTYLIDGGGAGAGQAGAAHVVGISLHEGPAPEKRRIAIKLSLLRNQLNLPRLSEVEITSRLKYLGFSCEPAANEKQGSDREFLVAVPSWRLWDIHSGEDLIEEFARTHGYNNIKSQLPPLDYQTPELNEIEQLRERIEPVLVGQGFHEVISKGFYAAADVELLAKRDAGVAERHLQIKNSLERSYSHMKVTNILHLARLADLTFRRGLNSFKVFEVGRLFCVPSLIGSAYEYEWEALTLAAAGRWYQNEWRKPPGREEVAALFRGTIEGIFRAIGCLPAITESAHPLLHPGIQGAVRVGRVECGIFGAVHPELRGNLGLDQDLFYGEFDLHRLAKVAADFAYLQPSDQPVIRRDITLKLPARGLANQVIRLVEDQKIADLDQVRIIDNFKKDQEDFRRVTFRLTFQSAERTLEHAEVDAKMESVLANLREHKIDLC